MQNVPGQFDRQSAVRIAAATRYVEGMQRNTVGGGGNRGGGPEWRLAKAIGEHGPATTQPVQFCENGWVEVPGLTPNAVNDSGVSIASGTKLYVARIAGAWRIVTAFVCEDV